MKELSIEEKAKAYDETIEKLRNFYRDYDVAIALISMTVKLIHTHLFRIKKGHTHHAVGIRIDAWKINQNVMLKTPYKS